jgi:hypothetical protein
MRKKHEQKLINNSFGRLCRVFVVLQKTLKESPNILNLLPELKKILLESEFYRLEL